MKKRVSMDGRLVKVGSINNGSIFITLDKEVDYLILEDFQKLGLEVDIVEEYDVTFDKRKFDIDFSESLVLQYHPAYFIKSDGVGGFRTSSVQEIYNDNFIRTYNSIYFIQTKDWVRSKRIEELI